MWSLEYQGVICFLKYIRDLDPCLGKASMNLVSDQRVVQHTLCVTAAGGPCRPGEEGTAGVPALAGQAEEQIPPFQ